MLPPTSASLLKDFVFERVINDDPVYHRLIILGTLPTRSASDNDSYSPIRLERAPAVISLQKTPFGNEDHETTVQRIGQVQLIEQNDIYSEAIAWRGVAPLPDEADYKISLIVNATPEHIAKKTRQKQTLIRETPDIYKSVILPYIESIPPTRIQWVYNILSHKKESDKILFEDPSPTQGFVLLPDFKWDLVTVSALYLVAIVHSHEIKSIRDLRKSHLEMLRSIRREAASVAKNRWGVGLEALKMFFHYQPSYYHLHVHVVSTEMEGFSGMNVGHAHLLDDVISLLDTENEGIFDRMTMTYTVTDLHPLASQLKESQRGLSF